MNLDQPVKSRPTLFRYPALYRGWALLSAAFCGLISLFSAVAGVSVLRVAPFEALLYLVALSTSLAIVLLGLDFATRSIRLDPEGLHVRWWLRRSAVPWPEVLGWHYLPLSVIHIRLRHGPGLFVWPLLENYIDLLNEIDAQRRDKLTR